MKLKHLKYKERLERLKLRLPTLRYRRTRGDMIEVYKILTESYCKSVKLELELHKKSVTRGHCLKGHALNLARPGPVAGISKV